MTVKSKKSKANTYKNPIDAYLKEGKTIEFQPVFYYLVEFYPSPLPRKDADGYEIDRWYSLIFKSIRYGFNEIYVPQESTIVGTVDGEEITFERHDFLSWQLMRTNAFTLLCLASKIEVNGEKFGLLLDDFEKLSENYDWDSLAHLCGPTEEENVTSLKIIERLKTEKPQEFMEILIAKILDEDTGVSAWGETKINNDNYLEVREMYAHWKEPLMLVSFGVFPSTVTPENSYLFRGECRVVRTYVRNYDEGKINNDN